MRCTNFGHAGRFVSLMVLGLAAAGCGLGLIDEDPGGADHLPTRGAGPYGKPIIDFDTPADEPYVVVVAGANLRDPAALARADGGFRLWFGYEPDPTVRAGDIWSAELSALTELPDRGPSPALVADAAWEQGWIGAPSVVPDPDTDGALVMFYAGGADSPGIGRADSSDGGATWQKHPDNPLLAAEAPAAARLPGGGWVLYATRPGRSGIFRADSTDGINWTISNTPALAPGPGADDFDRAAVRDPFVVVSRTAAGTVHTALFYTGVDELGTDGRTAIGWAGSFDGQQFDRFAAPPGPILEPGGIDEAGPTAVLEPDRGALFFHERRGGTDRIAVATHP